MYFSAAVYSGHCLLCLFIQLICYFIKLFIHNFIYIKEKVSLDLEDFLCPCHLAVTGNDARYNCMFVRSFVRMCLFIYFCLSWICIKINIGPFSAIFTIFPLVCTKVYTCIFVEVMRQERSCSFIWCNLF